MIVFIASILLVVVIGICVAVVGSIRYSAHYQKSHLPEDMLLIMVAVALVSASAFILVKIIGVFLQGVAQ